jgi:hypothetical protein
MSLPQTVAEVIDRHVTLELESLSRAWRTASQPTARRHWPARVFLRPNEETDAFTDSLRLGR